MADKLVNINSDNGATLRFKDMGDGSFAQTFASVSSPGAAGYQAGATPVSASSGNVANAAAAATLPAVAGKTTYVTGFEITGAGATAAAVVLATLTGLTGGTATYVVVAPAGATTSITPLVVQFPAPIPASSVNAAITLTLPALGAGNTNAAVVAHGFQL